MKRNGFLSFAMAVVLLYGSAAFGGDTKITLARPGQANCLIVVTLISEAAKLAAERLQSFIKKACGEAPQVKQNLALRSEPEGLTVILIGAASDFGGLEELGVAAELAGVKRDGYVLKTASARGRNYVMALGQSEKGAVNAVWRLMREIQVDDRTVSVDQLDVAESSPFIKTREVTIIDPLFREGPTTEASLRTRRKKYCPRNWDEGRLRNYVDLLDSFGYNSVQLTDMWIFLEASVDTTREQWRDRLIAMADQAHRNGQTAALLVLGSAIKDLEKIGYKSKAACFKDPNQREVLLKTYNYQADSYAPYVDRLVTHWSDPGAHPNCERGCTILTALEQHNIITQKFRKKNPDIESAVDLWNVVAEDVWPDWTGKKWAGGKKVDSILDAGILPPDVAIAAAERIGVRRMERIRKIADKGRKAAIWAWRTLDIDSRYGMHVHTKILEDYFRTLPPDASQLIEWYSVDDVSQFLILSNLYVAGQLMWDPSKSGSELLREFTRGMFGRENEEKMASVYEAVESAYCRRCPAKSPVVPLLLDSAPQRLELIRQAGTTLAKVRIASDFVPAFPLIIQPQELIEEIKVQLDTMASHIEFQVTAAKLLEMKASGAAPDDLEKAFKALPKVTIPETYLTRHTAIRYRTDIRALRSELGLPAQ